MSLYPRLVLSFVVLVYSNTGVFSQNWVKLKHGLGDYGDVRLYVDTERNDLYLYGGFSSDKEGNSLRGIARWDGYNYLPLAEGGPINPIVSSIARYNGTLYLSTWLANDSTFNHFIYWGSYNDILNKIDTLTFGPVDGSTFTLKVIDNKLYAAGHFRKCGNDSTFGLCYFDGAEWRSLYHKPNQNNYHMARFIYYKDHFYVGGQFRELDEDSNLVENFGILENNQIGKIGVGFSGATYDGISCMTIFKDELYIGGYFLKQDGNPGNFIVRWDGNQYKELGNGTDYTITDMVVFKDNLYVSGLFTYVDGIYSPYIARWDGNKWHAFNTDEFDPSVTQVVDLEIYNEELYIAGHFPTINGDTFNHVAKYNHQLPGDENEIMVYMNNVDQEIVVNYENSGSYKILVSLNSVNGQTVKTFISEQMQGYTHQIIPVTGLASGVYVVEVIANDKKVCKKLLKLN